MIGCLRSGPALTGEFPSQLFPGKQFSEPMFDAFCADNRLCYDRRIVRYTTRG
jgi:hypothetical protein